MTLRSAAAAVVATLLAVTGAACGDDAEPSAVAPAPAPGATAGTLPGGAPTPTSAATSATTTTVAAGGGPTETATTGPAATTPLTTVDEEPSPATLDGRGPVGSLAAALLRPELSERLVLEVHADAEPRGASVAHAAEALGEVSGKPVAVVNAAPPGGGAREWTSDALVSAADEGSTSEQGGGVAIVRLLFVRGTFEGDDGVLGIAIRGDLAAVFVDRVNAAGGLLGGAAAVETAVTTHELGHLLGLVDLVVDTGRADREHPGHSASQGSVMYWAVESDVVGQVLGANPPSEFDADDLADLATIRDGG